MVQMKHILLFPIFIFGFLLLLPAATRVVPMPRLVNPDELQVQGEKMFIGEFPHVSIYSTIDFKLLKKFGKKGEGPKEFISYCVPLAIKDRLIVSSQGKVSFFTLDGHWMGEKKVKLRGASFKPAGDYYGVYAYANKDKVDYRAIDVYDRNFNKIKELYRYRLWWQRQGPQMGAYVIDSSRFRFNVWDHYLVWTDMKDFIVYIWDSTTDQVTTAMGDCKPVPVTAEHKAFYHRHFNKPRNRQYYLRIKPFFKFPTYFPPIKGFALADQKIYVYTYQMKGQSTQFFIFNMDGKLHKKTYIPLQGGIRPEQYPFCFGNNKLYQLIEGDEWELHITDIQ